MARRRFTTTIGALSIAALAAACGGQPAEETLPEEGAAPEAPAPAPETPPAAAPMDSPAAPMDTMPADTADTTGVTGGQ